METAASERINQVARLAAGEDKPCQVRIGFHWTSESLLADEGQGVRVINDDKPNRVGTRMDPLTKVCNLVANRMNSAILFTAEPQNTVNLKRCLRF